MSEIIQNKTERKQTLARDRSEDEDYLCRHFTRMKTLSEDGLQKFERLSNHFEQIKTVIFLILYHFLLKKKGSI